MITFVKNKKKKYRRISSGPLVGHIVKGPLVKDRRVSDEVIKLHQEFFHDYNTIAQTLYISVDAVRIIIDRENDRLSWRKRQEVETAEFPGFASEFTEFCPGCGHTVRKPCLVCWLASQPKRPSSQVILDYADATDSLSYDLYGSELEMQRLIRMKKEVVGDYFKLRDQSPT